MKKIIIVCGFILVLLASLFYSVRLWFRMEFIDISSNGMMAIFICIVVSLILGSTLMALVFFSSRSGYDDKVDNDLEKLFQNYKKL